MGQEIERKFLVKGDFRPFSVRSFKIMQGYLCSEPGRTVRVRIKNDQGFITVKGMGNHSGMSRFEWEKEIPVNEAFQLLELCEEGVIEKIRYEVPEKSGLTFEVDEFHGALEGLVLAEIELPSEDYPFVKPAWLGKEVTGDKRYYNSALAKKAVRSNKKSD